MGRKLKKWHHDTVCDSYDDFGNCSDETLVPDDFAWDEGICDWDTNAGPGERDSLRRKSGDRFTKRKVYSELNDWEEFGDHDSWYLQ